MAGLLALLGGGGKPALEEKAAASEGPEKTFARDAFSALKDDDEEGFVEAFIAAVKACTKKSTAGGYEDETEEDAEY
jgi:hypothetical protein